ncbi:hypothetical protein M432DRAFT_638584 [Thermoascus aurantiacus ATCC 26904]
MLLRSGVNVTRLRRRAKPLALLVLLVYGLYSLLTLNLRINQRLVRKDDSVPAEGSVGQSNHGQAPQPPLVSLPLQEIHRDLVVASTKSDNTSWLYEHFPDWHKSIYVVDDANAELTVEMNKGRESMVYLTYIIDNYDHLPDVMLFIHSQRYQWHNDDPYYDGVPMISKVQTSYIEEKGYVNLRCTWVLGCPDEIHPFTDTHREDLHAGEYFKTGFMELFPGAKVPEVVGVSCCAQFGVSRWKVWERPKSDYEHFRKWLIQTPLKDELSGRIMEYSWHMIFGMEPVYCPRAQECYCKVFGLCNLTCAGDDSCEGRYVLPRYSTLPSGWPYRGWDGQPQDPTKGLPNP